MRFTTHSVRSTLPAALAALLLAQLTAVVSLSDTGSRPTAAAGYTSIAEADIGEVPTSWSPKDYDGVALTQDAPDLNALHNIHGVYMHPIDTPSRFEEFAAYFQAEQRRASQFVTNATGMGLRWDERISRDGRRLHDITVVQTPFPSAAMSDPAVQFDLVVESLNLAGLTGQNKKYYVWLDATSVYCGQGHTLVDQRRLDSNRANDISTAVSYRVASERYEDVGGFCNPVLHELSHNMGALGSHMPGSDGSGHCKDDANDIMCMISSSPGGKIDRKRGRFLDSGNDDYLDPAADRRARSGEVLDWWTINLSRFWCPRSTRNPARPDCSKPNDPDF